MEVTGWHVFFSCDSHVKPFTVRSLWYFVLLLLLLILSCAILYSFRSLGLKLDLGIFSTRFLLRDKLQVYGKNRCFHLVWGWERRWSTWHFSSMKWAAEPFFLDGSLHRRKYDVRGDDNWHDNHIVSKWSAWRVSFNIWSCSHAMSPHDVLQLQVNSMCPFVLCCAIGLNHKIGANVNIF